MEKRRKLKKAQTTKRITLSWLIIETLLFKRGTRTAPIHAWYFPFTFHKLSKMSSSHMILFFCHPLKLKSQKGIRKEDVLQGFFFLSFFFFFPLWSWQIIICQWMFIHWLPAVLSLLLIKSNFGTHWTH